MRFWTENKADSHIHTWSLSYASKGNIPVVVPLVIPNLSRPADPVQVRQLLPVTWSGWRAVICVSMWMILWPADRALSWRMSLHRLVQSSHATPSLILVSLRYYLIRFILYILIWVKYSVLKVNIDLFNKIYIVLHSYASFLSISHTLCIFVPVAARQHTHILWILADPKVHKYTYCLMACSDHSVQDAKHVLTGYK